MTSRLLGGHIPKEIVRYVDDCDKLLLSLQSTVVAGSMCQQTAVRRIQAILKEVHAKMKQTANYLNEKRGSIRCTDEAYVTADYELASALESLNRIFIAYGEAKQRMELLDQTLEIAD